MKLNELLGTYFLSRTQISKQATRDHYCRCVRLFGAYLGHDATIDDLSDENLAGFMLDAVDSGLTEATANQRSKQIRALWEWAARRRIVHDFPTVKPLKQPESQPVAYSLEQLQALFEHCSTLDGWIGPRPEPLYWRAVHWWWWDTAERVGATMALEWAMVELETGLARLPGNIRKNGKRASYRLSETTVELLTELGNYPRPGEQVFWHPWKRTTFEHRYRRLIEGAGLPYQRHKSGPHKMRRTVLTMIECNGGNATAFAQHSSRKVTESYIDSAMVMAHSTADWPRDINPEKKAKSWWKRMVG